MQAEIIRQRENRIRELEEKLKRLVQGKPIETYLAEVAQEVSGFSRLFNRS